MSDGIYDAASGASAQAAALDIVANNLANVSTQGFKAQKLTFKERLAGEVLSGSPARQVLVDAVADDFRPGGMHNSGNPLDIAIDGPGFFVVQTAEGERYTRAGSFVVGPGGQLVTLAGDKVVGTGGAIQVPKDRIATVSETGEVLADREIVGQLKIVDFDKKDLTRAGYSLWQTAPGVEAKSVEPKLLVGTTEGSNVNAVTSMTELVTISRAYESMTRAIEIMRSLDERAATQGK